ncbi:hypothetical protein [Thaumasiovibrio sp. DFM-14]
MVIKVYAMPPKVQSLPLKPCGSEALRQALVRQAQRQGGYSLSAQ